MCLNFLLKLIGRCSVSLVKYFENHAAAIFIVTTILATGTVVFVLVDGKQITPSIDMLAKG